MVSAGAAPPAATVRNLLVDDNPEPAAGVRDHPTPDGQDIDCAGDAVSGLQLCVTQRYDTVVPDVGPPGVDGIPACRELCAGPDSPGQVRTPSARDTLDDKVTGLDAGAAAYLALRIALPSPAICASG